MWPTAAFAYSLPYWRRREILKMVENGRNSNFQGLVTLTLDLAIRHTVVHHSKTSIYTPNFIEIEETFCGRTYVQTDGRTDGHFPPQIIRSTFGSRPNNLQLISCGWLNF